MKANRSQSVARGLRVASLVVPATAAGAVALTAVDASALVAAGAEAMAPLWAVMLGALAVRAVEGAVRGRRAIDHLDVLTPTGHAMVWGAAAAIAASVWTGFASLAVIGLLGLGIVAATATWTALAAGGDEPWRAARVERAIVPALAVEGDPLREEVRVSGVRIPPGFRLFASGRASRHAPVSRYVVGSEASGADVKLESAIGSAQRGEHAGEPMRLWLGDVLGICRTPTAKLGEATYTALPKPGAVDGTKNLLGKGGDDTLLIPARKFPTEGLFRLREYAPGDDTRRIHWVRSLNARQLVVRLPDEVPPAEPAVRLILDTHLLGVDSLTSRAPAELLDAMVRVWLGVGRALADGGTRVTLVAAGRSHGAWSAIERPLTSYGAHGSKEALKLGARAAWQPALPLASLLAHSPSRKERQVVVSSRPRPVDAEDVSWVVVPEVVWTMPEPWAPSASWWKLPFPIGSADNRLGRRRAERKRLDEMRRDGAIFNDLMCWTDWKALQGAFVARPNGARIALEVIP